jgi:CubicO group peptidase (beta-lactamase class C family)
MQPKRRVSVAFVLLCGLASPLGLGAQERAASRERIRSFITGEVGKPPALMPSMVIAVVKDDVIVWEEAFGWADQQRRVAATTTTPYYLASVTKVLTSTALVLLANEGRIDMNRSVNAYLGSHKLRPALWDENAITVERVANQMSGLTTFDLSCASAAPCRLESAIDRFGVIVRPPGDTFDYSNLNYGVLGTVIAQASKQTYEDYLRRAIFSPLGMRDCGIGSDDLPSRRAIRYPFGTTRATEIRYSASVGASGAFCSAHSLALFARALLNLSPAPGDRRWSTLLPSSGVDTGPGQPAGLMYNHGWWIQPDYVGTLSIDAMGGTTDASALIRLIPTERLAVIVLANGATDYGHVADLIVDEFVPAIRERRKTWTPPPPVARQRRPTAPELVGTWIGSIDTYRGKRELTISIDAAGTVTGSLAGVTTEISLTNGVSSGPRVFGLLANADLGIDESKSGSYDVQLSLALYGSRLAGSASTRAHTGAVSNPVTFLAELTQRPN